MAARARLSLMTAVLTAGAAIAPAGAPAAPMLPVLPPAFEPIPGGYAAHGAGIAVAVRGGGLDLLIPAGGPTARFFPPRRARLELAGARSVQPRPLGTRRARITRGARAPREAAAAVRMPGVRPGVDIDVHARRGPLEFDLRLAPGADSAALELRTTGAATRIDPEGRLLIAVGDRVLALAAPVAYQERRGRRIPVHAAFRATPRGVGFDLGPHDGRHALVIDPTLHYASFYGGSGEDSIRDVALAPDGGPVVAGLTTSPDLPTVAAPFGWHAPGPDGCDNRDYCHDAFVARLSPDGSSLVFATYLGGTSNDVAQSVAVDADGNVYVGGFTASRDFPTVTPYQAEWRCGGSTGDGFVSKLRGDGTALIWSTFLGGCDDDQVEDVHVDAQRRVWLTGATSAYNFPTTAGAYQPGCVWWSNAQDCQAAQAFVARLSADGRTLEMSTMFGAAASDVVGRALDLDAAGRPVVAGTAYRASDFKTTPGAYDTTPDPYFSEVFVARFSADGAQLQYSTTLGGKDWDEAADLEVDGSGGAVVVGTAESADFPTTDGAFDRICGQGSHEYECTNQRDGFAARIADDGTRLDYSTFLGGLGDDFPREVAVLADGAIMVAGGASSGFPVRDGFPADSQTGSCDNTDDCNDAFLVTLEPGVTALRAGTVFGSGGHERAYGLAVLPGGAAWIAGETQSPGLSVTSGAIDRSFDGPTDCPNLRTCSDAFIARIGPEPTGSPPPDGSSGGGDGGDSGSGDASSAGGDPAGAPAEGTTTSAATTTPSGTTTSSDRGGEAGGPDSPAAPARHRRRITVRRTATGTRWTIIGRVRASGLPRCRARVPVALQRRSGGRWRTSARTRTTSTGRFRFRVMPMGRVRVRVPAIRVGAGHRCLAATRRVR